MALKNEAPAAEPKRGRLLVVDDEPAVARALGRILQPHDVVIAQGGQEALDVLAGDPSFDAIVCDLMMPGVSGIDLYESLLSTAPDLARRVVFVSGGAFTPRARDFIERHGVEVIDKPCDATKLHAAVADRFT